MLSKDDTAFFRHRISLMYRCGEIGLTALVKSAAKRILSVFRRNDTPTDPAELYVQLYTNPSESVCRLFGCAAFPFAFLAENAVCAVKSLVRRNKIRSADKPYTPFYDEFISYFLRLIDDGEFDRSSAEIFIKICGDRLYDKFFFPHSDDTVERERFYRILDRVEDEVILKSGLDEYHRHFLLSLKYRSRIPDIAELNDSLTVSFEGKKLISCKNAECRIHRIRLLDGTITVTAEIRSPVFDYVSMQDISVSAEVNGERTQPMQIAESCRSWFRSYEKTARFYFFEFSCNAHEARQISFTADIAGCRLPAKCSAYETDFYASCLSVYGYAAGNRLITLENGSLRIELCDKESLGNIVSQSLKNCGADSEILRIRNAAAAMQNEKIHLYSDYSSVGTDNGYYQFIHDLTVCDGVKRYYISHGCDIEKFTAEQKKHVVRFGSEHHITLFLAAEKIFASFVDAPNSLFPFGSEKFRFFSDMFRAEIIYLQHGVLHAHIPWRYSPVSETFFADKIVVSSSFEVGSFTHTYHFPDNSVITSGMSRYDHIPRKRNSSKKILYAPSWRAYTDESSAACFMAAVTDFLSSEKLADFLGENRLYLDFKPHPLLEGSAVGLTVNNPRIRIVSSAKPEDYLAFITDFSSYVFDFVYLSIPIIYFFPDRNDFISGKYQYRQLDLPFENAFGRLFESADDAVGELAHIAKNGFIPDEIYKKRMEEFFFPLENCCEKLCRYFSDKEI